MVPLCVCHSSARAVSGRRLSTCDAYDQFFCKKRKKKKKRRTMVGIDHVEKCSGAFMPRTGKNGTFDNNTEYDNNNL